MMIFYGFAYFISLLVICYGEQGELEIVDDAEMVGLIRNEKYVIVLFSKNNAIYLFIYCYCSYKVSKFFMFFILVTN